MRQLLSAVCSSNLTSPEDTGLFLNYETQVTEPYNMHSETVANICQTD